MSFLGSDQPPLGQGIKTRLVDRSIGTPEEVIEGSKEDSNDNDYDFFIDFFNSATALNKAKREHLEEVIDVDT